jgi:hypothetical protein
MVYTTLFCKFYTPLLQYRQHDFTVLCTGAGHTVPVPILCITISVFNAKIKLKVGIVG